MSRQLTQLAALPALLGLLGPTLAHAADIEAGRAKVQAVCSACHGQSGVSVSDSIPNLAAQRPPYLEAQLRALKEGTRKNPVMNAIASQLSAEEIANVAAYFGSLPGATSTAGKSDFMPSLAKSAMPFREVYRGSYTKYKTMNFPATRQVRYFYANETAMQAAREGRPVPNGASMLMEVHSAKLDADKKPVMGADGYFVADQLIFYSGMAREAGWGRDIPEMLRNEDWNYAVFTPAKQHRAGVNQAECLACHKPLGKTSYMLATAPALAQTAPSPATSRGALLYETHCIACHSTQVHWRNNKAATDWTSLKAEVRRWQGNAKLAWTDADIDEVARHLNDSIYRFPRPTAARAAPHL